MRPDGSTWITADGLPDLPEGDLLRGRDGRLYEFSSAGIYQLIDEDAFTWQLYAPADAYLFAVDEDGTLYGVAQLGDAGGHGALKKFHAGDDAWTDLPSDIAPRGYPWQLALDPDHAVVWFDDDLMPRRRGHRRADVLARPPRRHRSSTCRTVSADG